MLHLIYTDLSQRVVEKAITLENFVLFFHKNGFWGERLFREFDYSETNVIAEKEFIVGMGTRFFISSAKLFKTNEQQKIELLFKEFSNNNQKKTNG